MEMVAKISSLERKIESLEAIIAEQSGQNDRLMALGNKQAEIIDRQSEQNAILTEYNATLSEQNALLLEQNTTLTELAESQATLIKFYEEQFALSQRRQFGASSEQTPDQLRFENLFNEIEALVDPSLPEPEYEDISYKRKKRTGKRDDDLSGLPVVRIDYELPESERTCPECGDLLPDIGVTVRRELDIIPAQVQVKEHAVHAYGECGNCDKESGSTQIIRADSPMPLIVGSLASPSAVAHIAAQKYVNGVPLYRTEKGFTYDGVVLSRQTMSNWLVYCAQTYLAAIYAMLVTFLLNEDILHADETSLQVLHEPGREAKTKSFEWIYRTGRDSEHPIVVFEYKETRNQEHPRAFLKGFKGHLHCDGYQAYHGLPPDIVVVGCWSHARRYWDKLYKSITNASAREGSDGERGLVYINLLFLYEHEFRDMTPEERLEKRLEFSKPVSDEFFEWVGTIHALPKSLLGEAVTYATLQRKYLENIYLDGRLEISNNAAERALKTFVSGRKVWLFSNTPNGAESSSIYYTITETAKENNLNPFQYLKYLLEKLPTAKHSGLEELLPWSKSLPECCRVPMKESNKKPEKPMYSTKNKSLRYALQKLRKRFEAKMADEPG